MESLIPQRSDANFVSFEPFRYRFDLRNRTTDDLMHAVIDGYTQSPLSRCSVVFANRLFDFILGRKYRCHTPKLRNRRQQSTALSHKPQAIFQAENPCRLRRCKLTQTVTDHDTWFDANRRPQSGKSTLQRIDRWLGPRRIVEVSVSIRPAEHHVKQRNAAIFQNHLFAAIQHGTYYRLSLIKRFTHPDPLTALAGVNERDLFFCRVPRANETFTRNQLTQLSPQRIHIIERYPRPVLEMTPAHTCRPSDIRQIQPFRRLERIQPIEIFLRQIFDRIFGFTRQRQHTPIPLPGWSCRFNGRTRLIGCCNCDINYTTQIRVQLALSRMIPLIDAIPLQNHVGVRTRPSETTNSGYPITTGNIRPFSRFCGHLDRQIVPIYLRIWHVEMQVLGDHTMLQRQNRLHHSGNARRRLQVSEIRLYRSDK